MSRAAVKSCDCEFLVAPALPDQQDRPCVGRIDRPSPWLAAVLALELAVLGGLLGWFILGQPGMGAL